jgi:restriction endonuclease S subunit
MAVWSEVSIADMAKSQRFDSNYWKPEYLEMESVLASTQCERLENLVDFIRCGPFGSNLLCETYVPDGVIVLRPFNIKNMTIENNNLVSIPRENCIASNLHFYKKDDIAFARVGDVRTGIVPRYPQAVTISPNIIIARPDREKVNPYFLTVFMNSQFGLSQLERAMKVVAQPTITVDVIKGVRVPKLGWDKQAAIEKKLTLAFEKEKQSQQLYRSTETLLLSELHLDDLDTSQALFYETTSYAIKKMARLDAEHFQPRYYHILDAIKKTKPQNITPLGNLVSFLTNGHTPLHHDLSIGDIPFLTAEHVFDFRINYESEKRILKEHHEGELKRTRLREGDFLITIKGRIGNAAIVENIPTPTNINQDVAMFRLNGELPPYYLMAFINSLAGKAFIQQYCTGQINPFLGLGNLRLIPIPIYKPNQMEAIAEKTKATLRSARAAQEESARLLAEAKQMVEDMILHK